MGSSCTIDITKFQRHNIIDSCSVSNVLSSLKFYHASINAGCQFYCTTFVLYECLYKPFKAENVIMPELRKRLHYAISKGDFKECSISIEDLQEVDSLKKRKNLSKGELSSMVFARKTGQAFLTDDQKARFLAVTFIENHMVQTTPHLFGWLFYNSMLSDGDKDHIINEHNAMRRPLGKFYDDMYLFALEQRLKYSS